MDGRIADREALKALREQAKSEVDLRSGPKEIRVTVHMGTCGIAAGAREVIAQIAQELEASNAVHASLGRSGCVGLCDQEPMLTVTDKAGREWRYGRLTRQKVSEIMRSHVLGGQPVTRWLVNG